MMPAPQVVEASPEQSIEQLLYARLLDWGAHLGLVVLVLTFAAYALGWSSPYVPLDRLPDLWSQPVASYLRLTNSPSGWGWLAQIRHVDMAALSGIVLLAGCSLPCLAALVPLYLRRGDKTFVALCLAEVAVVLLAASGWIGGGH